MASRQLDERGRRGIISHPRSLQWKSINSCMYATLYECVCVSVYLPVVHTHLHAQYIRPSWKSICEVDPSIDQRPSNIIYSDQPIIIIIIHPTLTSSLPHLSMMSLLSISRDMFI